MLIQIGGTHQTVRHPVLVSFKVIYRESDTRARTVGLMGVSP